jgi:hypothetical protein
MELLDGFPAALVPEAPFPLPDLRPADAIPRAQRASDASAAVPPDEAADAPLPALADAPSVGKLAALEPAVPAQMRISQFLPAQALALCTQGADRSAA